MSDYHTIGRTTDCPNVVRLTDTTFTGTATLAALSDLRALFGARLAMSDGRVTIAVGNADCRARLVMVDLDLPSRAWHRAKRIANACGFAHALKREKGVAMHWANALRLVGVLASVGRAPYDRAYAIDQACGQSRKRKRARRPLR